MTTSRIGTRDYPGKDEILAAWKWGISRKDGDRPITTLGEATDAMDLAYRAFEQRDHARAALGTLPDELAAAHRTADRLRTECRRALDERDAQKALKEDAQRELKVARDQRTLALALAAVLTIVLAFAL